MNINVEPYEEVDIQVGKVEEKNEKSKLQMFSSSVLGKPLHQSLKYTQLHNILSIAMMYCKCLCFLETLRNFVAHLKFA